MDALILLIPLSLILAGGALAAFLWTMRSGQYDDLDAVAHRILFDDDGPRGERPTPPPTGRETPP
jgi:cbb3-type cytochrome oxidase maturation protein